MDLVDDIYRYAATLPAEERYGLRSQVTRCAVSIPSNIAEGSAKSSNKDFIRFLGIALGSCFELETQLLICARQDLGTTTDIERLINCAQEIQKMLMGFQNYLGNQKPPSNSMMTGEPEVPYNLPDF